jgi:hypothetical protein
VNACNRPTSALGCSRHSDRRPAASGLLRSAQIFSFFLAPYEAIDLGAADRLAQDQRVGDPADGVGMTGKSVRLYKGRLSSPSSKNISVFPKCKSSYDLPSHPERGALRNVINAGRVAVDEDGASDESA